MAEQLETRRLMTFARTLLICGGRSTPELAASLGVTPRRALRLMRRMEDQGLVREVSGWRRKRWEAVRG